jgi:hypothetical protein
MRKLSVAFFAISLLSAVCCHADGGAIIARETVNGLRVTVLVSPVPLRAGPVDVSVLVQEGERTVLDAAVEVAWRSSADSPPEWLPPCCTMDSGAGRIRAARAHSNNKFLYSAIVPIRSAGSSELVINVSHGDRAALVPCPIEVGRALPRALAFWPWLVFPPIAIAGFALHQRLVRSRQGSEKNQLIERRQIKNQ